MRNDLRDSIKFSYEDVRSEVTGICAQLEDPWILTFPRIV
jgi:hypothetical protein